MPELPEVQTTVNGLNKFLPGLTIVKVWSDWPKLVKSPAFKVFKREIIGKKIIMIERRGKNVIIKLSEGKTLLIHMKMTGHLMRGQWKFNPKTGEKYAWTPENSSASLSDPYNRFIHFIFFLDDGYQLSLCDSRKFAKISLFDTSTLNKVKDLRTLGREPLDKNFKFKNFALALSKHKEGRAKQVLLNQSVIAGIGNIYSDEILWEAGVHPQERIKNISPSKTKCMYTAMKKIFKKSIKLGGDSMSDYRNVHGEKGRFQNHHRAYRKTGEKCLRQNCSGVIEKIKIGGRSAHFCGKHQVRRYFS